VCPLLNNYSDIYSVNYSDNSEANDIKNGLGLGSGCVSLSHLPSRIESGSSAQFPNVTLTNDAKGNSFKISFQNCDNLKVHIDKYFSDHFEHVFSSIGPTGAEIWPFKGSCEIWPCKGFGTKHNIKSGFTNVTKSNDAKGNSFQNTIHSSYLYGTNLTNDFGCGCGCGCGIVATKGKVTHSSLFFFFEKIVFFSKQAMIDIARSTFP
jgi:hypothetical protein